MPNSTKNGSVYYLSKDIEEEMREAFVECFGENDTLPPAEVIGDTWILDLTGVDRAYTYFVDGFFAGQDTQSTIESEEPVSDPPPMELIDVVYNDRMCVSDSSLQDLTRWLLLANFKMNTVAYKSDTDRSVVIFQFDRPLDMESLALMLLDIGGVHPDVGGTFALVGGKTGDALSLYHLEMEIQHIPRIVGLLKSGKVSEIQYDMKLEYQYEADLEEDPDLDFDLSLAN